MSDQIFELKGNLFTLSVLHLYSTDIPLLAEQLYIKIAQAPKFFEGAPIVVNLIEVKNNPIDFVHLRISKIKCSYNRKNNTYHLPWCGQLKKDEG